MPINDNDYSCHTTAVELFNQSHGVHITPHNATIVINNLGGGHTHTYTHTHTHTHNKHTHTDVRTETILRNQAHAWFKNDAYYNNFVVKDVSLKGHIGRVGRHIKMIFSKMFHHNIKVLVL